MSKQKSHGPSFADVVAEVTAQPPRAPRASVGRDGVYWGDRDHRRYELIDETLDPSRAVDLARAGAAIVYDACGCGGEECDLDWLDADDVTALSSAGAPVLRPAKHSRADLEHWRSADGYDLIVAALDVSWGDRIPG